jgi:hypothetical protein
VISDAIPDQRFPVGDGPDGLFLQSQLFNISFQISKNKKGIFLGKCFVLKILQIKVSQHKIYDINIFS